MRLNKEEIYNYLFDCQKQFGGYTGNDIEKISHRTGFDRRTVKRSIDEWSRTDIRFAELKYISKHSVSVTLEDIAILNQHLKKNITIRGSTSAAATKCHAKLILMNFQLFDKIHHS